MSNYAEITTAELIALLFKEEDRAPQSLAEELIRRGEDAAVPLREILQNEDYWYEGQGGDHWIVVHAIIILAAMRDAATLPLLLEWAEHAYFSNHDGATDVLPPALANYGEQAIDPLIAYILNYRGAFHDNADFGQARHDALAALTRIGLEHPNSYPRIRDFVCDLFTNQEENDPVMLSLSAAFPYALDPKRGRTMLREAHQRDLIRASLVGEYRELTEHLGDPTSYLYHDLNSDLLDFYHPAMLADRDRQREAKAKDKLYWFDEKATIPSGYVAEEGGNLRRAQKIGRNDPCPCGSGKKYKKCCG